MAAAMSTMDTDFAIIGAGMAGASAAYELAAHGQVLLLERESQPGYHTTGRSAALYTEGYGNAAIRAITTASRAAYLAPPPGFTDRPLLTPRGSLLIARPDQAAKLPGMLAEIGALVPSVHAVDAAECLRLVPVLRREALAGGIHEPDAMDIDVNGLHRGYLRGLAARGGKLMTDAEVLGLERSGGRWQVRTPAGTLSAAVVINAAGAWADVVGGMVGAAEIGLVPKRRTILVADVEGPVAPTDGPFAADIDEGFYFRTEAGRILGSPADETPSPPCDAQPEELDIALAIDRMEQATTLRFKRIVNKWAGLRSFVADKTPVAGFDPAVEGFFWLAGQGGYGIQTAPAMGRIAAALATGADIPADVAAYGITAATLSPARAGLKAAVHAG